MNQDTAPPGMAEQLISISNKEIVSILAGSVESGQITLMTELGKIDAQLVDGAWRVDATRIIEIDKQNAERRPMYPSRSRIVNHF